ncbi:hypothetical protein ACGF3C_30190 [Micromonospora sp. NPDC047762]|uniref:hypothetical protein n=1 Tax=Micromonospora sp. NPDC047762 TaxID=3364255 RepID=UPI00371342EE
MDGDVVRVSSPHVNELLSANFWWLRGNDPGHGDSFDRTRLRQLAETYLCRTAASAARPES